MATSAHFPFGENWYESGGTNKLKFTSYERDAESGMELYRPEAARTRASISRSGLKPAARRGRSHDAT